MHTHYIFVTFYMLKRIVVITVCLFSFPAALRAADAPPADHPVARIVAWPNSISLSAGQSHRLLLSAIGNDSFERDITNAASFVCDKPDVATVDSTGCLRGLAEGSTTIHAAYGGRSTDIKISIRPALGDGISFVHDVLPVLNRAGCNIGNCHAKPDGQNGFKLSVFSYDPKGDYRAIVKGDRGRRIFPADPEESLLLKKPTQSVEHGGGQRFKVNSDQYRLLVRWIQRGMPYSQATDASLNGVEIYPTQRRYHKGDIQQTLVLAHYSDGSTVDVTDLSEFKTNASEIAAVREGGQISVKDLVGEAVITARFMGEVAASMITVPADRPLPDEVYAKLSANNFIDSDVYARLKELAIAPSPQCTDSEFIRRASLDAIGVLPTPEDAQAYLDDTSPDKRIKLVDRLLENPAYADYWATKWGDLIRPNHLRVGVKPVFLFDQWIRQSLRENKPYNQFVREILTASGNTHHYGPVVVWRDRREPVDATTLVSQIFLGVRLECAKCHHHPNEKWGQADFYSLAAYFAQTHRRGQGISAPISGEAEFIYFAPGGEVTHPLTGETMHPKPPDGPTPELSVDQDPRQALADWMVRADNPFFARAIVNRMWGELMGRGIVHPVDDFRATNPPTNPRLLEDLASDFVKHGYDLKHLIRTILNSRVYQQSSMPNETNAADTRNFSRSYRRRLPAEVLCDAAADFTQTTQSFEGLPNASRAVQAWNNKLESNFLDAFGRPNSSADCPCDRDRGTSVVQMLHLMNSPELQNRIESDTGRAARLAKSELSSEQIIRELYLAAYSRLPDQEEIQISQAAFSQPNAKRKLVVEDLMWALMNSAEFVFNH